MKGVTKYTTVVGMMALLAVAVTAFTVGDNISPSAPLQCAGKTYDNDLSDGDAMLFTYSTWLEDPDSIIRTADGGTLTDNQVNQQLNFITDKEGTWTTYGELTFIEYKDYTLFDSGVCDDAFTVTNVGPVPVCGDNSIDAGETCDDGNTADNDGCSSICQTEFCGDGITQTSEQCDGQPNCDASCNLVANQFDEYTFEISGACRNYVSIYRPATVKLKLWGPLYPVIKPWGPSFTRDLKESRDVEITKRTFTENITYIPDEKGYWNLQAHVYDYYGNKCYGNSKSDYIGICGDGIKDDIEQCDDGNFINGDGCSDECKLE